MYRIGSKYKLQRTDKITYTGTIIEEDKLNVRIETTRSEEIILKKEDISQAKLMDRIENGTNKKDHNY